VLGALVAVLLAPPAAAAQTGDVELAQETRPSQLTAAGDTLAWSHYDPGTSRYQLMVADGAGVRAAAVAPSANDLDADLGLDAAGSAVAVYPRCTGGRCSVWLYDVARQTERRLVTSSCTVAHPSLAGARIAYRRQCGRRTEVVIASLAGGAEHRIRRTRTIVDLELGAPGVLTIERGPCVGLFCAVTESVRLLGRGRETVLTEVYTGDGGGYYPISSAMFDGEGAIFMIAGPGPAYVRRAVLRRNGAQAVIRVDADLGYAALTDGGLGFVTGEVDGNLACRQKPCSVLLRTPRPQFAPIPDCDLLSPASPCHADMPLGFRGRTGTALRVTLAWWKRRQSMELSTPRFRTPCRGTISIASIMRVRNGRFSDEQERVRVVGRVTARRVTGRIVVCGRSMPFVARPIE
jgi:hypothetical protein